MSSSVGCPKLPIGRGCVSLGHLVTYSPPREEGWLRQRRRRGGRSPYFGVTDHPGRLAATPPHEEGNTSSFNHCLRLIEGNPDSRNCRMARVRWRDRTFR